MHREDIKAALRKAHGSLIGFEIAAGLPAKSVKDVLRGRSNAQAEAAIASALNLPLHELFPRRYPAPLEAASSTKADASTPLVTFHRLTGAHG